MKKIDEHNLIILIKEKFPNFFSNVQAQDNKLDLNAYPGDILKALFDYSVFMFKSGNYAETENTFNFIELLMCYGDELVQVIAERCFLCYLLYMNSYEIQFVDVSKYLGEESTHYLKRQNKLEGYPIKNF